MVRLSRCCTPGPGDEILGFVTRGRGVSVHRADCANAMSLAQGQADRLIDVDWDESYEGTFVATIENQALDRGRLLPHAAPSIADHHINILRPTPHPGHDRLSTPRYQFVPAEPARHDALRHTRRTHAINRIRANT